MANTRELRRRIKSVKNTSQITKAMQMVAATKMRRAQVQATSGRPYAQELKISLSRLLPKVDIKTHPLLLGNDSDKQAAILLSTDKGLVGALNTNLIRTINLDSSFSENNIIYYTVGKKGRSFVVKVGGDLRADFENLDTITFRQAKQLARLLMDSFQAKEIGQAFIIDPQFISTLKQEPRKVKLLPIDLADLETRNYEPGEKNPSSLNLDPSSNEFIYEPGPDVLLDYILVHHLEEQIYQALLETKASEHSARMIAMQNATDNAKELVEDLTLTYNQTRQSAITTELLEITTAQVAMQ